MSKRVLLTGVSGFAGSHILEHLLVHTDWDIVGIASWKHKGTPERIQEVLKGGPSSFAYMEAVVRGEKMPRPWFQRVEIITHDLESPIPPRTAARIGQCDYILNVASESHVDRSIEDPVPFVLNNVNLVLNMLEFARQYKPEVFLQFSTDEVYGVAPEGVNHTEWSSIVPSNPYSASKACQEAIAISYWRTYGVPLIITNTMNLFGETQDPEKYIAKIIRCIQNNQVVPVHGREGNIGSRYYLHARNMADAVLYLLNNVKPVEYQEGGTLLPERFNIVGDVELNNLEVADAVATVLDKEYDYQFTDFHATRPGHDRRYALDGAKLRSLGWKAPLSFEESLKKCVEWTLKHSIWL